MFRQPFSIAIFVWATFITPCTAAADSTLTDLTPIPTSTPTEATVPSDSNQTVVVPSTGSAIDQCYSTVYEDTDWDDMHIDGLGSWWWVYQWELTYCYHFPLGSPYPITHVSSVELIGQYRYFLIEYVDPYSIPPTSNVVPIAPPPLPFPLGDPNGINSD